MKFVYPEFLWSLFALAIPIIIHLFNFRKYKTLYFSSLKFIKHVDQQTRSTQKLKHLLVLFMRLLALACLIFAFAQPFIPVENSTKQGGKPVLAIYIDNSFSMTAKGTEGELLSEAREMARQIIEKTNLDTRILLTTNALSGLEQRLITKVEALEQLDKIEPIALTRQIDDVLNWQRSFLDNQHQTVQRLGVRQYLCFSDFQKQTARFSALSEDKGGFYYPIKLTPQDQSNLYIDSVWFSSPIQKIGENNELNVRVINSGKEDITNVELSFESGSIKRDVFLDIEAGGKSTVLINYTEKSGGNKSGRLSLNDKQLFWDDEYYFSYFVDDQTKVLVINGDNATSAVNQVYSLEKHYSLTTINLSSFTLDQLNQTDLVFLNSLDEIPSAMSENLVSFVRSGGTLALFPGAKINVESWNRLLKELALPLLGRTIISGVKIDKLNYEDPFFYGMFEKKKENLNLPSISKAYQVTLTGKSSFYELIRMQNGLPLFLRSDGNLNTFLFTSSLLEEFGTFTSDALFPSITLRIGEMSQRKAPIFLVIGKESLFPLYKKSSSETPIHLKNEKTDFIPQTKQQDLMTYISLSGREALENLEAGTYEIIDEGSKGILSLNYDRSESKMDTYSKDEIIDQMENEGIQNVSFSEISEGQSLTKIDIEKPFEYWKVFILLALLFLIAEMLILKFWK